MKILGVDPSLRETGYCVLDTNGGEPKALAFGTIKNKARLLPSRCLVRIADTLKNLIQEHQPGVMAVEGLFYCQNMKTALTLGQARGAALLAAAEHGLEIFEYAPRKVKQSIVGHGGAQKLQVGKMVQRILGLETEPPEDAADALAIALCHAQSSKGIAAQINPPKQI
jgi:crossover junction endodeoxyribonuclease RuvC